MIRSTPLRVWISLASVCLILHPRIADRAEQNGVVAAAELINLPRRQADPGFQVTLGAEIEVLEGELKLARAVDELERAQGFVHYLDPNSVAWNHRDARHAPASDRSPLKRGAARWAGRFPQYELEA